MATQDELGIKTSQQFQLEALSLMGAGGVWVDLREQMKELSVFEDLFGSTMSGNLLLNDTRNLINIVPIVGFEYLAVTFSKPSVPQKFSKIFRVYKITNRIKRGLYNEDYVLHFCSEESILSESQKISKAYTGLPVSDMVRDITRNYLFINSTKLPDDNILDTRGNFNVVIPYWSPFYTINWLSRMARTGLSVGGSFVFYEDRDGYHFTSIESLCQLPSLQYINFTPLNLPREANPQKSDMDMRMEASEGYQLDEGPDLLRSISTGMYAGKLVTINPLDQRINVRTMNAATQFASTKHLNANRFMQSILDRTGTNQTDHNDAFFRVALDNLSVELWMLQRNAYLSGLHEFRLRVVMPGNPNFTVGKVVTVNCPIAGTLTKEYGKELDNLFSGNYIISAIRHKIDRLKYVCILELSKDSVTDPLPLPLVGSTTIQKLQQA